MRGFFMIRFIVLSIFWSSFVYSQKVDWENFVPSDTRFYPVARLKIVIHVLQKSDGSNNFQDTEEHKEAILKIFFHAHSLFSNLKPLKIGQSQYIPDSRIRLVFSKDEIYFHQNDRYNDLSCIGKQGTCSTLMQEIYNELITKNPKQDPNALHIFLGEGEEGKGEGTSLPWRV
jgi:hypothetical protein